MFDLISEQICERPSFELWQDKSEQNGDAIRKINPWAKYIKITSTEILFVDVLHAFSRIFKLNYNLKDLNDKPKVIWILCDKD